MWEGCKKMNVGVNGGNVQKSSQKTGSRGHGIIRVGRMKLLITLLPIQSVCMYRRHVSMCHHMCVRVSVCACTPLCVTVYACSRVFAHKEKYRGRNVAQLMGSDRTAKTTSRIKLILAGRGAKGGREHYGPGRTQRSGPASSSSQR